MATDATTFEGKVVVVTGGTKGIGRVIVEQFLTAGADVLTCGRHTPDDLPAVAGRSAAFVEADLRDPEQCAAVVDSAHERWGRVDVAINNAGGSPAVPAVEASPRFTESIVRLNLLATLHVATAANRHMQLQDEGGSIVNISSVSGLRPSPGTAAYGAAKAGVLSLTQSLALEWAPKVRINAVTCGMIATEESISQGHYGDADAVARVAATVPLGRFGTPADVADACRYLASPMSSYVTGTSLLLHGGGEWPAFHAAVAGGATT